MSSLLKDERSSSLILLLTSVRHAFGALTMVAPTLLSDGRVTLAETIEYLFPIVLPPATATYTPTTGPY